MAAAEPAALTFPYRFVTPAGTRVMTTGHRATGRSDGRAVPGICGTQKGEDAEGLAIDNEYCVFAIPGKQMSTAIAFMSSAASDIVVVMGVPYSNATVWFRPSRGRGREGVVLSPAGHSPLRLGLVVIPRRALDGRVVIQRGPRRPALVSRRLTPNECSATAHRLRLCSLQLDLVPPARAPSATHGALRR